MDIKTKYSVGDRVYSLNSHRAKSFTVETLSAKISVTAANQIRQTEEYGLRADDGTFCFVGAEFVFSTKEDLLKSL